MDELFPDVPQNVRDLTRYAIMRAAKMQDPKNAAQFLLNFKNNMPVDFEDYIQFSINVFLLNQKENQFNEST